MQRRKTAAFNVPAEAKRQAKDDPTDSAPPKQIGKAKAKPAPPPPSTPSRYTYALKGYTCERRDDGWYVCKTPFATASDKPEWSGPFESVETACLAIARRLATELVDRHTRTIEAHKLTPADPLYGLKSNLTLCKG